MILYFKLSEKPVQKNKIMKKTNENLAGVIGITDLARPHNQKIGNYIEHYTNENCKYEVVLTDKGAITISIELAQDFSANPTNININIIIDKCFSINEVNLFFMSINFN